MTLLISHADVDRLAGYLEHMASRTRTLEGLFVDVRHNRLLARGFAVGALRSYLAEVFGQDADIRLGEPAGPSLMQRLQEARNQQPHPNAVAAAYERLTDG